MKSKMQLYCDYSNAAQARSGVDLGPKGWVAVTYGNHLRISHNGDGDGELSTWIEGMIEDLMVTRPNQELVELQLYHGRPNPEDNMGDWGFDHADVPGFTGRPYGEFVHIKADGVHLFNTVKGALVETFVPYKGDLIEWQGNYYGDFSIDPMGAERVLELTTFKAATED